MSNFIEELNQFRGIALTRGDGNKLIFQKLPNRKHMRVTVCDSKDNVSYIVGYITNEKKLKDIFLDWGNATGGLMDKKYTQYIIDSIDFKIKELMLFFKERVSAYQDFEEIDKFSMYGYVNDKAICSRLNDILDDYNFILNKIKVIK